jgi:hypothetical protein
MIASNLASYGNLRQGFFTEPQQRDPRLSDYLQQALGDYDDNNRSDSDIVIYLFTLWYVYVCMETSSM